MDVFQAALIVTLRSQELILSCLKDMKAKSYMINFQSDIGKDRKSKIENVIRNEKNLEQIS